MKNVEGQEKEELVEIRHCLMEVLAGNLNAVSETGGKKRLTKAEMYKTKIRLPIIESIIMENGQFLCWLFTDVNGYVMKKNFKKLVKEGIILHFIHNIKIYLKANSTPLEVTDEQFLNDLNQFCSIADQNYSKPLLFKHPKLRYLLQIDKMKFIYVYFTESARNEFMNILEFVKIVNDSNKMNSIILIQNFMSIHSFGIKKTNNDLLISKEKIRYLIVKYQKKDETESNNLSLYYNKPKLLEQIDCEFKGKTIKNIIKKQLERRGSLSENKDEKNESIKKEDNNDLIMVNNENLIQIIQQLINPFLKLIGEKKIMTITQATFTFIRVKDDMGDYYAFQSGERLIGISRLNEKYMNKTINNNNSQKKEKALKNASCFGDFCEYVIPQYFKNIKKNNQIDEFNKKLIPSSNKFTSREKNDKLPYSLPVFQIKKAYDNPHLVNIVLKAYSIFPKNFDKETEIANIIKERKETEERKKLKDKQKEEERKKLKDNPSHNVYSSNDIDIEALGLGTSFDSVLDEMNEDIKIKKNTGITLYNPIPNKFRKDNYDEMYNSRFVCENCFKIYTLIYNFLSNIDETTFQFKSLSKAKDILLQGENLNLNLNLYEDHNQIGNEENLLFQEEIQEISLKKMIKKNLVRERLKEIDRNKKKEKQKIGRNIPNKKEEFGKAFSYKIDINPKLLKLNLVAEKSKNKFFKLIFNELKAEPETLYQKLCIQKPDYEGNSSMKALRMHMGINSHIYNPNHTPMPLASAQPELEESFFTNIKQSLENKEMHMNAQRENNQIDNDIFLTYKNILKKTTVINNEQDSYDDQYNVSISEQELEKSISEEKENNDELFQEKNSSMNTKQLDFNLSLINEKEEGIDKIFHNKLETGSVQNLKNYSTVSNEDDSNSIKRIGSRSKTLEINKCKDLVLQSTIRVHEKKNEIWTKTLDLQVDLNKNKNRNSSNSLPKISTNLTGVISNLTRRYSNAPFRERENKRKESLFQEKQIKLKQFIQIDQSKMKFKHNIKESYDTKVEKEKKNEKITLFTIVNDRTSTYKIDVPYYYITTPLPKFNEGNIVVTENPLLTTQNIQLQEYIQIGKFKPSRLLSLCEIFVYDPNTAIPFKVVDEKTKSNLNISNSKPESKSHLKIITEDKSKKLLIVVINDFFDSYDKYENEIKEVCRLYCENVEELKCVFFNLPGQSSTMWSKKCIFNNMYYSTFLDRFLFYLSMKQYFDNSYKIILLGFGNGGNIALTYTSFYEKYCDFIHSVIMINSFCDNDTFLNTSMVEILKIINNSKGNKLVDFFIKSVTVDPQTLIKLNMELGKEMINEDLNPMTLAGYHNITKGYFFNLKINHKDIKTKIVAAHSNQNCFISINNLNPLFSNSKVTYFVTQGVEIPQQKSALSLNSANSNKDNKKQNNDVDLETEPNKTTKMNTSYGKMILNTQPKETNNNRLFTRINTKKDSSEPVYFEYSFDEMLSKSSKRKLIVIEGSHDLKYNDSPCIQKILLSYLKFIGNNNLFQINR